MNISILKLNKEYIITEYTEGVTPSFKHLIEASGHKFLDCIHPEDVKKVREIMETEMGTIKLRLKTSVSSYQEVFFTWYGNGEATLVDCL
jgi:hypothetical protein